MQFHQLQHLAARLLRILLLSLIWYVSCYFLMMDWRVLAYDGIRDECTGESGYYMAPMVRVRGDLTVYGIGATWANTFYRPLDLLFYGMKAAIGFRVFSQGHWTIWLFIFGLNLLLPFFFSIFRGVKVFHKRWIAVILSLIPTLWYGGLILLYHLIRVGDIIENIVLGKILAILGTLAALTAMYFLVRAGCYKVLAPLAVAIVSGTIWLIVSLPYTTPGWH